MSPEFKDMPLNFVEFPPISRDDWESVIIKDLKGADYDKKLKQRTENNIVIQPYYRQEDLVALDSFKNQAPGRFPFLRGAKKQNNNWLIKQDIITSDVQKANRQARQAIDLGAQAIGFHCLADQQGLSGQTVFCWNDFETLMQGLSPTEASIHWRWPGNGSLLFALLSEWAQSHDFNMDDVRGCVDDDGLANALRYGLDFDNINQLFDRQAGVIRYQQQNFSGMDPWVMDARVYHQAGSSVVQELGSVLAVAVEYLHQMTERGLSASSLLTGMPFVFSISSDYFLEIAKFRAARLLWAQISQAYVENVDDVSVMRIFAETSLFNKTIFDADVNTLRSTMEATSAIIAGVDVLTVQPGTHLLHPPDESDYRLSRNTQLVIKHEAHLDKVIDPANGSYYIESLTQAIANEALEFFKMIEDQGGWLQVVQSGWLQNEIRTTADERRKKVRTRRVVVLGTNQYPDMHEVVSDRVQGKIVHPYPDHANAVAVSLSIEALRVICQVNDPLPWMRLLDKGVASSDPLVLVKQQLSQEFDALRLATEAFAKISGRTPKVLLWTAGHLVMRQARATFSANFFRCAGYEIVQSGRDLDIVTGLSLMKKEQPDIVVICGSDADYPDFVPAICDVLQKDFPQVARILAGYPKDHLESLQAAGIEDFIHIKTDAIDFLNRYQKRLGVIA